MLNFYSYPPASHFPEHQAVMYSTGTDFYKAVSEAKSRSMSTAADTAESVTGALEWAGIDITRIVVTGPEVMVIGKRR